MKRHYFKKHLKTKYEFQKVKKLSPKLKTQRLQMHKV